MIRKCKKRETKDKIRIDDNWKKEEFKRENVFKSAIGE